MKNPINKALAYFFTMLMILLIASVFLISCNTKKPFTEIQKSEIKIKDSLVKNHKEIINNKIVDSIRWKIGIIKTSRPECDSITQTAITQLLMRLQTSKQSGDNGYELKYNQALKQLELVLKIAATKSTNTNTLDKKSSEKVTETIKPIVVKKPYNWFEKTAFIIAGISIVGFLVFLAFKLRKLLPY